jgi:hypothetical protein
MPNASFPIFETPTSNVAQLHFEVTLKSASGEPLAGEDIHFTLEGDGSLSPSLSSKETARETNAEGIVRMTWYRRGIFGRDVRATFTASSKRDDCVLAMRRITAEEMKLGPRTGFMPERPIGR